MAWSSEPKAEGGAAETEAAGRPASAREDELALACRGEVAEVALDAPAGQRGEGPAGARQVAREQLPEHRRVGAGRDEGGRDRGRCGTGEDHAAAAHAVADVRAGGAAERDRARDHARGEEVARVAEDQRRAAPHAVAEAL